MCRVYCFLFFLIVNVCSVFAQSADRIYGIVRSSTDQLVTDATVTLTEIGSGKKRTFATDKKAAFYFSEVSRSKKYEIAVTHIGHEPFYLGEVAINQELFIQLVPKTSTMEQVVVVGYGTQKKVNLTGAVDQIGSEYFEDRPSANITRSIQGAIPNLNIKMVDGKPTRSATFNIRGLTSIGSGGSALVLIDGVPGDPANLNPNDVESVSVLKDASSAAIYGARAAFGVVLITTKSPKKDKIQVNYSSNYSINQRTITPDLISDGYIWAKNFDESFNAWNDYQSHPQSINSQLGFSLAYLDSLKKHSETPGMPITTIDPATGKYQYFANTDWFKELYKDNNATLEHALSISGGTDKANYSVSGRYYFQDGIFRYNTDKFHRYNFRVKGGVQVTDWLSLNTNTDFSTYKYTYPLTSVGGVNAIWRLMAVTAFPVSPLLNPDGTMTIVGAYSIGDFYYGKSKSVTNQNFLRNTIGFNASIIKNKFSVKGDFSYLLTNTEESRKFFTVPYSIKPDEIITSGLNYLSNNRTNQQYFAGNIYSDFLQRFGKNEIKLVAGVNIEKEEIRNQFVQRDGLLVDDMPDFNLATGLNYRVTGGGSGWGTVGGFYRLNYAFDQKYLLEFNGRYDGSSKFPKTQQYGFFPSASAGWKISEEKFMHATQNWLDALKLRASYGALGNGNIAPYTFMQTLSSTLGSVIINGNFPNYISAPGVVPNGLTWEKSTTIDVGLDVEVLHKKLLLTADWYQRNTTDMITAGMPLPALFGATVPRGNYADLKTKGWEVSLTWRDQFNLRKKPFKYDIRATLADNVSYITDFNNPTGILSSYYKGQRVGDIWGFVTEGFFSSAEDIANHANQSFIVVSQANKILPGDLKFRDLNGDKIINRGSNTLSDPGDQQIIGNTSIRLPYGVTANADWNNFSLSVFVQGVGKRDWFPSIEAAYFWGQNNRPYSFLPSFNLNRWTEDKPDHNAYFPRYRGYTALSGNRELAVTQTRYLQNASYVRLKNITLGYSIPKNIVNKIGLSGLRFYFTGQNLFTWSPMYRIQKNFDPEVIESSDLEINAGGGDGFSYPMQKSYTVGINVNF